jgi:hypothetical protein
VLDGVRSAAGQLPVVVDTGHPMQEYDCSQGCAAGRGWRAGGMPLQGLTGPACPSNGSLTRSGSGSGLFYIRFGGQVQPLDVALSNSVRHKL